jgi:hypothetical protein
MGQEQDFLTIRDAWMEGKAPLPSDPVSIFETNFKNLLGLLLGRETKVPVSPEKCAARHVTIINKLSGKALEVENAPIDQAARIYQVTRNDAPNQPGLFSWAQASCSSLTFIGGSASAALLRSLSGAKLTVSLSPEPRQS